jgi:putative protease
MSLSSAGCIEVARDLGLSRVVMPRELSVEEIKRVHESTDIPVEAFVHGALCVAYSGQCLTSEALGGRSANRGQCAQACRLPYDLIVDGKFRDLGSQQYLLSPQDLAAFDLIPQLIAAGVCSFKIEGRLKTPEYVANITSHYRRAIDQALAGQPVQFTKEEVQEMELSFSRGFSHGWLDGNNHKVLVPGLSSAKRGIFLGTVREVTTSGVRVQLAASVARGDGIVFAGDRAAGEEQGGRVYDVRQRGQSMRGPVRNGMVELKMAPGALQLQALRPGQHVWKTDDPQLTKRWRQTFSGPDPLRRVPIDVHVRAEAGKPLFVEARLPVGRTCEVVSEVDLLVAEQHPLTVETLQTQLGRLGATPFVLRTLTAEISNRPMMPLSELGAVRKRLIVSLTEQMQTRTERKLAPESVLVRLRQEIRGRRASLGEPSTSDERSAKAADEGAALWVMCRRLEQVKPALATRPAGLYVDFHDIRQYRTAVAEAREAGIPVFVSTIRIQKPGEEGLAKIIERAQPDGILARNLATLRWSLDHQWPTIADFSLNAANDLTADWLIQLGAQHVVASYDLNRDQLLELVRHVPPEWLEVVIHQHMAMFHMEHCVFCSVLSPGTNKTNCGRPCDRHVVHLRDRMGKAHSLVADVACRNTLFNATAQSGAELVPGLRQAGVQRFRVELLEHDTAQTTRLIELHQQLLTGQLSGTTIWRTLRADNRVGITRGTNET